MSCLSKEAVDWLNWRLGLAEVPRCNCEARERWLNTLGGRAVAAAECGGWLWAAQRTTAWAAS